MQDLTPPPLRFRLGIWLMLSLSFNSVAAFAQTELNPVHNVRLGEPADAARVIVKFKQGSVLLRKHALSATASASETLDTVTARANSLGARLGVSLRAGRALNEHAQVVKASGIDSAALAERLAAEADVEYAVVDQRRTHFALPNDPLYTQGPPISGSTGGPAVGQWYLHAPAGEVASSINATSAWDLTTGSSNIVVAVLDTGVRPEHPDLANRLLAGYDMVSDVQTANDGNGREADASDPGDWVTASESNNPSSPFYQCGAEDSSWHGTKTASLIGAATNNGVGMAGVAGGVKLLPVRVLGKCGGYDSDIIAGMSWAAGLPVPGVPTNPTPARVINMSLGGSGACHQSYLDAINAIVSKQNPAVIVAAAGNSVGHAVGTPANCPGVIGVAGLRHIGTKVGFSDLGPEISISAPGGNCVSTASGSPCQYPILAATNTGITTPVASSYTDSFNASVGTSFSAPLVAGTVALMLSAQPWLTPTEVKAALQISARAFPPRGAGSGSQTGATPDCHAPDNSEQLECYCTTSTCGAGMLDAASAVATLTPASSVEFYKADINQYFMTASPDEAAFLDNKPSWGWTRTGKTFNIWLTQALAPSRASPVCRFYGVFANGTVGSHFYTADPDECAYVKGRIDWGWGYEGNAFYAIKPAGGSCPSGTSPIYRVYNNGMGGAPSHRYMTNQTDVNTMVSQGWVSEGTAFCGAQ